MRRPPTEISDGSVCVNRKFGKKKFWGREAVHRWFWAFFKNRSPNLEKNMFFCFKIRLFTSFLGKSQWKSGKKNVKNDFSEKWLRRPPTEISCEPQFFDRNFVEKQFRGRGAPIDDLGPLFQKSKPEISAKWEKTCFLCCRFFWIGNKSNSVVFSGRLNFFCIKTY